MKKVISSILMAVFAVSTVGNFCSADPFTSEEKLILQEESKHRDSIEATIDLVKAKLRVVEKELKQKPDDEGLKRIKNELNHESEVLNNLIKEKKLHNIKETFDKIVTILIIVSALYFVSANYGIAWTATKTATKLVWGGVKFLFENANGIIIASKATLGILGISGIAYKVYKYFKS